MNPTITIEDPTPTQAVIKDANRIEYGADARGRKIGVRRVDMSVRRRVLKALSAESGEKSQYLGLAWTAAACVSIDNESIPFPSSELQIDALIDRLGDEGMRTVSDVISKEFTASDDEIKN